MTDFEDDIPKEHMYFGYDIEDDIPEEELTAEELIKRIYDKPDWVSHVNDRLSYKEYIVPEDENESLDLLISLYTNKKSKRVNYAGNKLKKVFNCLPPVEKRKVGIALLNGNKTDSEWVCKNLDSYKHPYKPEWTINWHPCYAKFVEDCWNKYHGYYCGKLMVQFLDEEIVQKHIDEFNDEKLYFYLCRRFLDKPWFKLDVEKLKACTHINAYLSIMSKTTQGISEDEGRLLLYQWIAVIAEHYCRMYEIHPEKTIFWNNVNRKHQVINTWGIDTALYYMLEMGHKKVVKDFIEWSNEVSRKYLGNLSPESDSPSYGSEFCQEIFDNFPDDLSYLLNLNSRLYSYMSSLGQPLTKPRKYLFIDGIDYCPKDSRPYLESLKDRPDFIKNTFTEEDYDRITQNNPNLKLLIDSLDLSLVSLREGNSSEDLSEYERYLEENAKDFKG